MKKITLLLTLLLCVAGTAWAQFTDSWTKNPVGPWVSATSGFVPAAVETLRANYQTSLNNNERTVSVYYYEQPVKVTAQGDVTVTFDWAVGNSHGFRSFGVDLLNESNTVVKSHYEIKLANANNDAVYTLSDVAAGTYRLRYFALNEATDNALTESTGTITVTNAKKLKVSSLAEFSNSKLYVIKSGRSEATKNKKHYLLYHNDGAGYLSSTYGSGHSMTFSPSTTNFQFAVLKKGEYYFIYNVYAQKFIGNVTANNTAIPMVEDITNNVLIRNSANGIYNFCLSTNNGAGALNTANIQGQHGVVNWVGGKENFTDPGNVFEIYEVGDMDAALSAALQSKLDAGYIPALKNIAQSWVDKFSVYTFGSKIGQYSCSVAECSNYLSTARELIASPDATADQLNEVISNLATAYPTIYINQPQVGHLYRFKGVANEKYISSTAVTYTNSNGQSASMTNMSLIAANDYTTVFMYCEGGKLLSFGRGNYVNATHSCNGVGSANGNAFTFSESTARIGKYRLQSNASGVGTWLVDHKWNETTNQGTENEQTTRYYRVDRQTGYNSATCDWTVEEVEWLPININVPYNVGTIYSPVPLRKDESRLKFYTGKVSGSELVLTQYTGNVIPANVPFLVVGQSKSPNDIVNGCMYFEISSTDGEAPTAGTNDLQGQQESFAKGENSYYTLQPAWDENDANHNSATDVAFRLFDGTNLQGFRAYLPANLVTGTSLSIRFEGEDDITGIDNTLTNANGKQEIFDLTGRRVSRATKGLYIINGQKVLVK